MTRRTTVVLVDDHPIYRDGIATAIEGRPDLALVRTAANGADALSIVREHMPDVLVLDLDIPSPDGFAVLATLADERLPTRALVLSGAYASPLVYRAVSLGAFGYLTKGASSEEVCEAIAVVARGQSIVPPYLHEALASEVRLRRAVPDGPTLSPRELEIVRLTSDGLSTAEIAHQLHLSPATIKSHLQNVFKKLGVSDRAAAVARAMRAGLLD